MATTSTGRFVWHELHTTDRANVARFYAQLFGWETKEVSMGHGEPYVLCLKDGQDFAGITKSMAPANVPPHWLPYLGSEDVDATAEKVKKHGGKVATGPMDIPNIGRFAVAADPQGAHFALYKSLKPYPAEPPSGTAPPVGSFCWDELSTSDPAAAAKFYAAVFGYAVEESDTGSSGVYRILKRGDRQTAGVMKTPPGAPAVPHWLAYVAVANVDESVRNAGELRAKTLMPPMDIPKIGRFGVIADPTGAAIAFFTGA